MSFVQDFKAFLNRGNVVDLAVAVVVGGAFSKIVTSLVNDFINPVIGLILGKVNLVDRFVILGPSPGGINTLAAAKKAGVPVLAYGDFVNTLVNFVIIAFVIFLVIKAIERMKRTAPAPDATTKDCPYCFSAIAIPATRCPNCTSQLSV